MNEWEEPDTEEIVLTRWGKLKAWWEMGSAVVTIIKSAVIGLKLLFLGSTAAVVVGQAVDTNLLNDAAVEVGLVKDTSPIIGSDAIYEELSNLIEDVERLESLIDTHQHNYPEPEIIQGLQGLPGKDGQDGKSIQGPQGIPGPQGPIGIIPPAHAIAIDDALKRHIQGDH